MGTEDLFRDIQNELDLSIKATVAYSAITAHVVTLADALTLYAHTGVRAPIEAVEPGVPVRGS